MALAEYFHRAAVATAQILQGYDEDAIRERLEQANVGVAFSAEALERREGRAAADLLVRLLARLYPTLRVIAPTSPHSDELIDLAKRINPRIELSREGESHVAVRLGNTDASAETVIGMGSDGWSAFVGVESKAPVGDSLIPFGAGAAAALAAANVFRAVFLVDGSETLDRDATLSTWNGGSSAEPGPALEGVELAGRNVIVGAGAIGNGLIWAVARTPISGRVIVVDPETVELSNVQRYVLTAQADAGRTKTAIVAEALAESTLEVELVGEDWATFVSTRGHTWDRAIVALDSARHRRAVQVTLPRWIANAWTQPGDLGVSVHPWTETGACLSCLYLPEGAVPSEDKLIAEALGFLARPDRELQIRQALYANAPAPPDLLEEAAEQLGVAIENMEPFASRPIRELYTEGICGGVLLPLDKLGIPQQSVHVPVAHQSALAGVLLAAAVVADAAGAGPETTRVTRIDVLRPLGSILSQPAQKDPRGICICQDEDYREAYTLKYSTQRG